MPSVSAIEKYEAFRNGPLGAMSGREKDGDGSNPSETYIRTSIEHGSEGENDNDQFFAPMWPIQWIVWIFAGLWAQNDMRVSSGAMLEIVNCFFGMCSGVVEQHRAWHVLKVALVCRNWISAGTCKVQL